MVEVIDFKRIRQKAVVKLLRDNELYTANDLSKLRSLCYKDGDPSFYFHSRSFQLNTNLEKAWAAYKTAPPEQTWSGAMISFGLMYSRVGSKITYQGDSYNGLEPGQILLLNLNLGGGIFNLAVGHEVKRVLDQEFRIEICYLQNGASCGTQRIQLREENNVTCVVHETWYKSNSFFRDKALYPYFHAKAITEFHLNVKKFAEHQL